MNALPSRRWNPSFIALRWRHLFRQLGLLGLLLGSSVHFHPYFTHNSAKGQILIRSISKADHRTSVTSPTESAAATFRSDVVLLETMIDLGLPEEWRLEGQECVARLKNRIESRPDRKAAIINLSVKGHSRSEAIRIWNKLIEVAEDEYTRLENPLLAASLKSLEAEIAVRQKRVNSLHKALSMAITAEAYAGRHQKVEGPDTLPALPNTLPNFPGPRSKALDVQTAISERKQAVDDLESAQRKLAAETKKWSSMDRPFVVKAAPSISPPDPFGTALLSLAKYSTLGLSSGTLLALILAYLLELLFPRRSPSM